jgi:hypothetical protein
MLESEAAQTAGGDEKATPGAKAAPGEPEKPGTKADKGEAGKEPEKPAKEPERPASQLRQIQARERKLVERQEAMRREREDLSRQAQEIRQAAELHALAKTDPIAYLEKVHGISLEDLGRRILNDGQPHESEETKRTRAELATLRAEVERDRQEKRERESEAGRQKATQEFCALVRAGEKYPLINERYPDEDLAAEAWDLAQKAWDKTYDPKTGRGQTYTDEEIAEFLEQREARREAHRAGKKSASGQQPKGTETGDGKGTAKSADKSTPAIRSGDAVPTLSSREAGARASLPKDPLLMTEDDELAEIRRLRNEHSAATG